MMGALQDLKENWSAPIPEVSSLAEDTGFKPLLP